jgi:hypothetical protein
VGLLQEINIKAVILDLQVISKLTAVLPSLVITVTLNPRKNVCVYISFKE